MVSAIQPLSAKSTRRLARTLGEPTITRAWVDNAEDHSVTVFATWDHVHGWLDRRSGAWDYEPDLHIDACYDERGDLLVELDPLDDDGRWPIQGYDR